MRPFGTMKEFMWTKIPSLDWETDREALVCFFTSKCCCCLWKVAGQAFSSSPNSFPFPPFVREIHVAYLASESLSNSFFLSLLHDTNILLLYYIQYILYMYHINITNIIIWNVNMTKITFLKSWVASVAWKARRTWKHTWRIYEHPE